MMSGVNSPYRFYSNPEDLVLLHMPRNLQQWRGEFEEMFLKRHKAYIGIISVSLLVSLDSSRTPSDVETYINYLVRYRTNDFYQR